MTVPSSTSRDSQLGNGVTTEFTVPFRVLSQSHLEILSTVDDVTETLVLTTDYSVSDVGDPNTTVTFVVAPVTGATLTFLRNVPLTQETDYVPNDPFPAESHENALDKLTMITQQIQEVVDRSLTLPPELEGVSTVLPAPSALAPLVWSADEMSLENGSTTLTGDMLLRANLASSDTLKGESLVFPAIETLGAVGDGTTLDDDAFAAAAALGTLIKLRDGAEYYLSERVVGVTGTKFVCEGWCKVKLKTGTGGFNNVSLNSNKDTNSVFWFSAVDDIAVEGIEFTTDAVKEVTIYPIRVLGGTSARGVDIRRIRIKSLSLISGAYVSLNTIGDGGYRVYDVAAFDCGSAQGNTYWTGTPQVTVFEVDNDMVASVPSFPGYAGNIRAQSVLLTSTALTHYGQQTDVINIAGISGTDRKGPTIHGVYADGVGEVVDLFCTGATITGIRAKNVHNFVAKFIHGAQNNYVEVDSVESYGLACVTFGGSSSLAIHTMNNVCRVRTVKGCGDAGDGPTTSNIPIVLFQENGGAIGTCLPRNNLCVIDTAFGAANLDYIARDNCSVNNSNNNMVRLDRFVGTFATAFSSVAFSANMRARYLSSQPCRLSIGTSQTLNTGAAATVEYQTVQFDGDSISTVGSYLITPKYPGWYQVNAQVRISGANATDYLTLRVMKNGSAVGQRTRVAGTGATEIVHDALITLYIDENDVGTSAANLTIQATHTGAATVSALNTATMSYFEVVPVRT